MELGDKIIEARKASPGMPVTVLYERLISDGVIDPAAISRPTLYRYIEDMNIKGIFKDQADEKRGETGSATNTSATSTRPMYFMGRTLNRR